MSVWGELKFHSAEEGGVCNYHYALKVLRRTPVSCALRMCNEYGEVGVDYELVTSRNTCCMQLRVSKRNFMAG
jgi:hypothetical protein